jgi:tRNA nucleotidyltransferase (CCA-adding enzyme)
MDVFLVGGAVRDGLLGLSGADRDWVVVGATPQAMLDQGYEPVGRDFPVFLHPRTHEEYALARTERKTAPGYRGFVVHAAPDVTLEQDLSRRDLTINAMAQDAQGRLIDPFGGQRDLQARVFRHVTEAFREDPVRILRVARFAARFADFTVAPETLTLMREMVQAGEVDALVGERVWQELARGFMADHPTRMIDVLTDCGAWPRLFPQHSPRREALALVTALDTPLSVRAACVFAHEDLPPSPDNSQSAQPWVLSPWVLPADIREVIELTRSLRLQWHDVAGWTVAQCLACLLRCDAVRRPERLREALNALTLIARAHALAQATESSQPQARDSRHGADTSVELLAVQRLSRQIERLLAVDTSTASSQALAQGLKGPAVGAFIRDVQEAALEGT